MSKIKTRETVRDIKALDKIAAATHHVKDAYVRTKDSTQRTQSSEYDSPSYYAINKIKDTTEVCTRKTVHQAKKQGCKAVPKVKDMIHSSKEATQAASGAREVSDAFYDTVDNVNKTSNLPKEQLKKRTQDMAKRSYNCSHKVDDRVHFTTNSIGKKKFPTEKTIKQTSYSVKKGIASNSKVMIKYTRKSVKTAEKMSKTTIKTTQQAIMKATQTTAKAAKHAAQAARVSARATVRAVKITGRAFIASIKYSIAATKALICTIATGGWVTVLILFTVIIFGCFLSMIGDGSSSAKSEVSTEVNAYEPLIRQYAKKHGISDYVALIKAVMMQESGGRGNDPMQASECGYNTKYPRKPGSITDPEYSIDVGIQNLAACLNAAEVESPIDIDNIKVALQGYNFGNGYIFWAKSNYGGYTTVNAIEFSNMMAQRLGWNSYGDTKYIPHVLRYYIFSEISSGTGNKAIVQVALTQEGNVGGQPYWSWYGFNSRVEWCACFVSWCADQCGYIEAGIIPKFSLCTDGVAWFRQQGQWQDVGYTPVPGDIIFFDWGMDGSCDHVGIVESIEGGTVNTVEGNSGDSCAKRSYPLGNGRIMGYGTPDY